MKNKVIKNWKVVCDGLDFRTAYAMYKAQAIQGHQYDILAIRIGHRLFQPGVLDIEREPFTINESLSNNWEILEPDVECESYLTKLRELLKNDHFSGLTNTKIDNMNIDDIWYHIVNNTLYGADKIVKYRILKNIIENKLYKKV